MPTYHVLVVEDSLLNQTLISAVLTKANHTVKLAENGLEAIALTQEEPFHFVLMDVQMPEMDGLTATRLIREREANTGQRLPIVALTASEDRESCIEAGMDEFMRKPLNATKMLEIISRLVSTD